MKIRLFATTFATSLLLLLSLQLSLLAQERAQQAPKHHQYQLIDLGTFGGPNSGTAIIIQNLNNAGATLGIAQTTTPDPLYPNCFDAYTAGFSGCLITHAFGWRGGVLTDLGSLGGSSYGFAINNSGVMDGISETGALDPATGNPIVHAFVYQNGAMTDLGTFGGAQSEPAGINDRGQIVGWAMNTVDDPYSAAFESVGVNFGYLGTTQLRAFLWQNGSKVDMGTLGGPDAQAYAINQSGQIAGQSYTSYNPNPDTGIPTIDPFLWDHGKMTDLGTLGGTITWSVWLNDRGQVAGTSYVEGDQNYHAFLWDHGVMADLPPIGTGNVSWALWINNSGDVVGDSALGNGLYHAPMWTHGKTIDLGTVGADACSEAYGVNSSQQVVGQSGGVSGCVPLLDGRAFLWENGGPMVDLNGLVYPPSDLQVAWGVYVNDRGQILGWAIEPGGAIHAVLLVPHGTCDTACEQRLTNLQWSTPSAVHVENARSSLGFPQALSARDLVRSRQANLSAMSQR